MGLTDVRAGGAVVAEGAEASPAAVPRLVRPVRLFRLDRDV